MGILATAVGRIASHVTQRDFIRHGSCCSLSLSLGCGFWQELFEVFKQVWCRVEELRDLSIYGLNGLRFSLVGLQDFEELFVDFRLLSKAILKKSNVSVFVKTPIE